MYHDYNVFLTHKLDVVRRTSLTAMFSDEIDESYKIPSKLEESVLMIGRRGLTRLGR